MGWRFYLWVSKKILAEHWPGRSQPYKAIRTTHSSTNIDITSPIIHRFCLSLSFFVVIFLFLKICFLFLPLHLAFSTNLLPPHTTPHFLLSKILYFGFSIIIFAFFLLPILTHFLSLLAYSSLILFLLKDWKESPFVYFVMLTLKLWFGYIRHLKTRKSVEFPL